MVHGVQLRLKSGLTWTSFKQLTNLFLPLTARPVSASATLRHNCYCICFHKPSTYSWAINHANQLNMQSWVKRLSFKILRLNFQPFSKASFHAFPNTGKEECDCMSSVIARLLFNLLFKTFTIEKQIKIILKKCCSKAKITGWNNVSLFCAPCLYHANMKLH